MVRAIYPGSFDPITKGHLDIIERAARITDEVIVGILQNKAKRPLFSLEDRVKMVGNVTAHLENVRVVAFEGLLVTFAKEMKADVVIRGLRGVTDFEYEFHMAQLNRQIAPEVDTMFLTTNQAYANISSSAVKELASFGGDIEAFVPMEIADKVREKIEERGE